MKINILLITELLQYHILSYLSLSELCLLRRVSKYFNEEVTDKGVSAIAKCCCDLDVLHISSNYGITEKSIRSIAKNCKKLTKLDVAFCMIRSEAFQHYLNKKTSLKEIRVTKCPNISEGIIEKLVHQVQQIRWLVCIISICKNKTGWIICDIFLVAFELSFYFTKMSILLSNKEFLMLIVVLISVR
ncbi:protein AMN1 homolog isoform X2 [Hydractinia symbiolongicarpus]|uniref:protein AMN1 homolog isoform X2 n=1 Tax=Hydractinia symbiolongicarpus TaxID=13093 RepID=UPI00254EA0E4|nr:protein AMN1 homolog isoform X2 [Hydractinia symbiolongicarpus]